MKRENKIMIYLCVGNNEQAEEYDMERDMRERMKSRISEVVNEIFNGAKSEVKPRLIRPQKYIKF